MFIYLPGDVRIYCINGDTMIDENKLDLNYQLIAEAFKEAGISGSPVAVKFAKNEAGIPDGVEEISEPARHCKMVTMARTEGEILFARPQEVFQLLYPLNI